MDLQCILPDRGARPDAAHQLVFGNELPGRLHQHSEDLKGPVAYECLHALHD